jgi:tellurite resistance protein TehA-like permease
MINLVTFPDLSNLSSDPSIADLLKLPNSTYPFFWLWIIAGIWVIISLSLYFIEKKKLGKGNLLSAVAVACFPIIVLSVIGTIIGIISLEIMIYILILSFMIISVWFYTT